MFLLIPINEKGNKSIYQNGFGGGVGFSVIKDW